VFFPPYPAKILWGGKTSGGAKHPGEGGSKIFFACGALRKILLNNKKFIFGEMESRREKFGGEKHPVGKNTQ